MKLPGFTVHEDIRQGNVQTPVLFHIVMHDVIKETNNASSKVKPTHRTL